jgi:hypothetical protein
LYRFVVRYPAWVRAPIALCGLWLTAALTEAPGLHACAVHDGHAATPVVTGHGDHAAHMAHGSSAPMQMPADHSHHSTSCTCLGLCCCAGPVATPSSSIELAGDIVVAAPVAPRAGSTDPVVLRAYSLPFANGPPAI